MAFLAFVNVSYPGNAVLFFNNLLKIAKADVLWSEHNHAKIFEFVKTDALNLKFN